MRLNDLGLIYFMKSQEAKWLLKNEKWSVQNSIKIFLKVIDKCFVPLYNKPC